MNAENTSLTFHEWGHAWMASKCGDDTARSMGRCSFNPLVHIDPIGTFLIPMVQIFMPVMGGILIGWAKPVPVNPNNLRNPKLDDILISMAGPWMNLLLAVVLMGMAKLGLVAGSEAFAIFCVKSSILSLGLCFCWHLSQRLRPGNCITRRTRPVPPGR